jgi:PAS domain S-box-containing protein
VVSGSLKASGRRSEGLFWYVSQPNEALTHFPGFSYNLREPRALFDLQMNKGQNAERPEGLAKTGAEAELQQLVNALPQHILVLSADGTRVHANQLVLDYHGLTLEEFLVEPITNCFHPDDVENYSRVRNAAIPKGEPWETEARLRRKDGQYRWFLIRANPLRNDQNVIVRWYLTGTDIEDRKNAERELQQLVDLVPQLITMHTAEGRRVYANKVVLDYFGCTLEEFLQEDGVKKRMHPSDWSNFSVARERGIPQGAPFEMEVRIRRHDGQYRWFLILYNPHRNEVGQIVGWYSTGIDIQDRKQAERELRQMVDAVPQHIAVIDPDGRCIYGNKVALDYHGYTIEEFLDENALKRKMHPDDLPSYWGTRRQGISNGLPFKAEARLLSNEGEYRWFLVLFNPLKDDQGCIIRWYATATDIEDQKRAERAQRRSEAYLAEAQRLSHTGSFGWDVSSGQLCWSAETLRIFEFEPTSKVTIEAIVQRTHPEDRPVVQQVIERASRDRTAFDLEHRLLMPNGSVRYVHVVGHPSTDECGSFEFVGAVTDITERKVGEAAVRQSAEQLKNQKAQLDELFEQAPEGVVLLDVGDRILRINPEFTRIFGYTPEEATGQLINDLIAPEELRSEAEAYTNQIIHGKPVSAETIRRRKDGKRIHISLLAIPISVPGGGQIAEYAIYRNITERRSAEEALRRSEGYLAEAQRLSHTGSWAWDFHHKEIIHWSPETFRVFGFDPNAGPVRWEEARARIHPEDLHYFDQSKERVATEKIELEFVFRLVHPDGATKYAHCVNRPVVNASGDVMELVGSIMDVTDQYQSRAALEKAFQEIKELKDELYKENLALKDEIDQASMFEEIVGTSETLRHVLVQVAKVAPADSNVLITGETGTGKELVARAIHKRSPRSSRAFVSVNCASVPATLISSELFGHEKGAFTGATQRRLGRFELADGGTLFLDEVGELPAETQVSLLRVLQERQFERIGGTQTLTTNVRIIAATNCDLHAAIRAGAFRQDLFYRLNVFPIEVPPLRERKEDIPLLVEYLTERYATKAGKKIRSIEKQTLDLLKSYTWPGNIRELQNVIERAVILCDGKTLYIDEVWLKQGPDVVIEAPQSLARLDSNREKALIEAALRDSRGQVAGTGGAAAKLGIPRSTLETKIRTLGIDKHQFKSRHAS